MLFSLGCLETGTECVNFVDIYSVTDGWTEPGRSIDDWYCKFCCMFAITCMGKIMKVDNGMKLGICITSYLQQASRFSVRKTNICEVKVQGK